VSLAVTSVGICDRCSGAVTLCLDAGRRELSCECGSARVGEGFFATCGYGRADRDSNLVRRAAARSTGNQGHEADLEAIVRVDREDDDPWVEL
jgi:hypothetical protein